MANVFNLKNHLHSVLKTLIFKLFFINRSNDLNFNNGIYIFVGLH